MKQHIHTLSAIFPHKINARSAYEVMKAAGFDEEQLFLFSSDGGRIGVEGDSRHRSTPGGTRETLQTVAGISGEASTAPKKPGADHVTVFMADPVASVLAANGHTAVSNAAIGDVPACPLTDEEFVAVAEDAVKHGFRMLIAHARDAEQATAGQLVMGTLVSGEAPQ